MLLQIMLPGQFETVIQEPGPALVLFVGRGCPHCQVVKPTVRQFGAERADVRCYALDCDRFEAEANQHRIRSIPTIILFNGGRALARHGGEISRGALGKFVDKALGRLQS